MDGGFTKGKKLIFCVLLFLALGVAALTGVGTSTDQMGGITAAYADGCDGPRPDPDLDCPATPTPTPTLVLRHAVSAIWLWWVEGDFLGII